MTLKFLFLGEKAALNLIQKIADLKPDEFQKCQRDFRFVIARARPRRLGFNPGLTVVKGGRK